MTRSGFEYLLATNLEPSLYSSGRLLPDWQDTLAAALADDVHVGEVLTIDLIEAETDQLRHAQACGEGEVEHGPIPHARRDARVRETPGHFFERDPGLHALRLLVERFVARPLGACEERWVGSDWMIRNVLGLIAAMLMIGAASAAPASDPSYLGNWARADGKTHIRVEPCGKSVCGVNTWVRPGMKHEKVGDRLVLKIRPAGASRWTGSAVDPQRNQRYTVRIHVANKRMTTDGCVMGGLMCQSMSWTRLDRQR